MLDYLLKRLILLTYFAFTITFVQAEHVIKVTPKDDKTIFKTGENAEWDIYLEKDKLPYEGEISFSLREGAFKTVDQGKLSIKKGKAHYKATRKTSGTLLFTLNTRSLGWKLKRDEVNRPYGGAAFQINEIKAATDEPSDFDSFWQQQTQLSDKLPLNPKLEKIDHPDVDLWKIELDNINGTKIYGHIAKPKNIKGSLPAIANFEGAGVRARSMNRVIHSAKSGWLCMNIIAHSISPDEDSSFYTNLSKGELKGYPGFGKEDKEKSYFKRMLIGTYRTVEYLTQRPDWNGKTMQCNGGSQGGLQAIAATALHPKVNYLSANVPAGCDHLGQLIERKSGWPRAFMDNTESQTTSKYYDAVFFARRISCPTLVGVGMIDNTCPPEGVIAMYNQLKGPKKLVVMPIAGHGGPEHKVYWSAFGQFTNSVKFNKFKNF